MITARFEAKIVMGEIQCEVTVDVDLFAPVFCFSLMAPVAAGAGGQLVKSDGSYGEIQLPDLKAHHSHHFLISYADPDYQPINRAWLPLGSYLRAGEQIIEMPLLPAGITQLPITSAQEPQSLCLIPKPQVWIPSNGVLNVIFFAIDDHMLDSVVALAERCNLQNFRSNDGAKVTMLHSGKLASDAYEINITPNEIQITHGGPQGAHYAGVSLLVLRETHSGNLPCGFIKDHPRFEWRGQHLDCARHFYKVSSIAKLIDLMALLKMNLFHWHFSDDEAFRLELDCVPDLWKNTRMRGEGLLVPGVFGGGRASSGSYSKADAKTIIDHAQTVFIDVLPEIEFPAHALGFARTYPNLRDPDDIGAEMSVQGYIGNVLNPALPETWDIIHAIVHEVSNLFPFRILHLGADELPEGSWDGSPAITALKKAKDLEGQDDVLGWSLSKLAKILAEQGVRSAAWEEAARGTNGGIGNSALLFCWSGQSVGIEVAKAGYDIVMMPAQNTYLDMAHTDELDDWGAAWAAFVSLRDTVDWTVIPDPEIANKVIGVEGAFWSEFTTQDKQMEPMIAPRIFGIATKSWCQEELDDDAFIQDARNFCDILSKMGWSWNPSCFIE